MKKIGTHAVSQHVGEVAYRVKNDALHSGPNTFASILESVRRLDLAHFTSDYFDFKVYYYALCCNSYKVALTQICVLLLFVDGFNEYKVCVSKNIVLEFGTIVPVFASRPTRRCGTCSVRSLCSRGRQRIELHIHVHKFEIGVCKPQQ